jgi:hypothetical protein
MSETLKTVIVDAATGEVIERDFTEEETAQHEEMQAQQQTLVAEQEAKAAARISALAKLAELGLTEEEVAAL